MIVCLEGRSYLDGSGYLAAFNGDGKWQLHGGPKASTYTGNVEPVWVDWTGPDGHEFWSPGMTTDNIPNGSIEVVLSINDNGSLHDWPVRCRINGVAVG